MTLGGCHGKQATGPAMQAMPVMVQNVASKPVAASDTYVATIKSRRSATLQPQVDGQLKQILVRSGDKVKAGQALMVIDPLKQDAAVQAQKSTEQQKKAVYEYNAIEVERQRKLFAAGVTSRDALDNAEQAYANSKADYESARAQTKTQTEQLGYYRIRAPFDGVVGDIPVHVGDYVQPATLLTTVDEIAELEAYIEVPAERASEVKLGLPVQILDDAGNVVAESKIYFVSPEVDSTMQAVLAKAPVPHTAATLRNAQMVRARVIWTTTPKPTVPVLAVTRIGGQAFVYVARKEGSGYTCRQTAVTLGDSVGNDYPVLSGLAQGDKVILSGLQFLSDGVPVQPLN
jgi:RND family efflux transporter MFP subunit